MYEQPASLEDSNGYVHEYEDRHVERESTMDKKADVGLVGLAVMGQNLVLNLADNGYSVAVYNRTAETTHSFVESATSERAIP